MEGWQKGEERIEWDRMPIRSHLTSVEERRVSAFVRTKMCDVQKSVTC